MKRGSYLLVCLFTVFFMLMIPNISAIECTTVEDVFEEKYDKINLLTNIKIDLLHPIKKLIQISIPILMITLLNIVAFIISVIIGAVIMTALDSPIAGAIASFFSVFPLYLVVTLAEKIVTDDFEQSIANLEYVILCFLLGATLGSIIDKIS